MRGPNLLCALTSTLSVLLAACASAPTHFYTLLAPPVADSPAPPAAYAIAVEPVGVPAEDDQTQWLVRVSGGEVAVLDGERWAAPLSDELRAALAEELSRDLGAHEVYKSPGRDDRPVYRIQVQVRRFESAPAQYALIDADWSVARRDGATALSCHSRVSQPVEAGYPALALGHQRAVSAIAAQIAAAVRGMAGATAACPQEAAG